MPFFPPKQEFEDFLSALAPVLSRLSFAFARVVLVCEGSPGFKAQVRMLRGCVRLLGSAKLRLNVAGRRVSPSNCRHVCMPPCPQVLCGTERLLSLGCRAGLHLQCHATTSAAGTAAVVGSVARAWLAKWQAGGPGLQYGVAEEPTEEEAFLTRWVGCVGRQRQYK